MKLALVKTDTGLLPAYDSDKENYDKIGYGEVQEYESKRNRNLRHHRKFFALLRLTLEILPDRKKEEATSFGFEFKTEEDVLFYLKMKLGYYRERMVLSSGKIAVVADSISFNRMDQDEFDKFYSKSLDVILNLTGADEQTIETELLSFM